MKKNLFVLLISFVIISFGQAQTLQTKLDNIFINADMLELNRLYPQIKDNLPPSVDILCRTYLAIAFNESEKACNLISEMSQEYPELVASTSMISYWAHELYNIGEYKTAADILNPVLEQLKEQNVPEEYISGLKEHYKINQALRNEHKLTIIGNDKESIVPITNKDEPYIHSDVKLNGKDADAFYDTGSVTVLNEDCVKKYNVRILIDSVKITDGLINTSISNRFGIIDTLTIGSFKCCNVPCYIMKDAQFVYDIIIGLDLLRHFNEMRIYPKEKKLILSTEKKSYNKEHNYMMWAKISYLECTYKGERQSFAFDTGNNREGIYRPYYFNQYIERYTTPAIRVNELNIYQLKPFKLVFGNTKLKMKEFFSFENGDIATTTGSDKFPNGNIGVGFVNQCSELIMNFENMYYEVKK